MAEGSFQPHFWEQVDHARISSEQDRRRLETILNTHNFQLMMQRLSQLNPTELEQQFTNDLDTTYRAHGHDRPQTLADLRRPMEGPHTYLRDYLMQRLTSIEGIRNLLASDELTHPHQKYFTVLLQQESEKLARLLLMLQRAGHDLQAAA